jgi:hypothetical protein
MPMKFPTNMAVTTCSFVIIREADTSLNESEDGSVKKKCLERMKPIIPPSCL